MGDQSPRAPALSVDHLSKHFGDRVTFDDVSFEVSQGEVFGFLGPNGAGKTTTVRTLGTLIAPTSGTAMVTRIPLSSGNDEEIRKKDGDHAGIARPLPPTHGGRESRMFRRSLRTLQR